VIHPLLQLIQRYEEKELTEEGLREEAAKLPERTVDVSVSIVVRLTKTVKVSVDILTESAIDESGDVYNDEISKLLTEGGATIEGWDDTDVHDEDHVWVTKEKEDANHG
jgi:hypothetical protein